MKRGWWMVLAVLVAANGAFLAWALPAQARRARPTARPVPVARQDPAPPGLGGNAVAPAPADDAAPSVGDALLRPFDFPFAEPTTLADVQKHLARELGVGVALDRAALDRLDLDPEDTVQLELKGARLKTGLKLLLDQVGLTWRVEAEDNLLVLTDPAEAGEPIDRALHQLKALHDEMHDLQDAVDDLRDLVEEELGIEPDEDRAGATYVRLGGRDRHGRGEIRPRSARRPGPARPARRPAGVSG